MYYQAFDNFVALVVYPRVKALNKHCRHHPLGESFVSQGELPHRQQNSSSAAPPVSRIRREEGANDLQNHSLHFRQEEVCLMLNIRDISQKVARTFER